MVPSQLPQFIELKSTWITRVLFKLKVKEFPQMLTEVGCVLGAGKLLLGVADSDKLVGKILLMKSDT